MAVELRDYIDSLQRAVAAPGVALPEMEEDTWLGYLTDAFWEARLDGFMVGWELDDDGAITPVDGGDADIDRRWVSLVITYATMTMLRNQVLATQSSFRAKAGPVEFQTEKSASTTTEMLKQLQATRDRLLESIRDSGSMTNVMIVDAYSTRALSSLSYWGGQALTGV